jgi:AcrR family transcriptional regulator
MIELVAERGIAGITVRGLTRTSGVSTRTFYAHFANLDECFASAYRAVAKWMADRLSEATVECDDWENGLRGWIGEMMDSAARNPAALGLALVSAYDGGPAMLREISAATATLERRLAADPVAAPLPLARGIVAGVERVISAKLVGGRQDELPPLTRELADWAVRIHSSRPRRSTRPVRRELDPRSVSSSGEDPGLAAFRSIGGDRGRILAATAKLSAVGGYWSLTAPRVRRKAGVSRRSFEELFDSIADCYLEAIEALVIAAAVRAGRRASKTDAGSPRREDLGNRLCDEIAASPLLARLAFTDVLAPGVAGLRCRGHLTAIAAKWMHTEAPWQERPPLCAAEAAAAGGWRMIQADLAERGLKLHDEAPSFLACLISDSAEISPSAEFAAERGKF